MNRTGNRYESGIKPLKGGFLAATVLVLALATTLVCQERSRRVLEKTRAELSRARDGLARVQEASMNRRQALATIKLQLAQEGKEFETSSPEKLIYGKVDEIKTRLKPNDMTITNLENKGGDISLQYTLKFINPDYSELLNAISRLQQAVFPFTPVNSIAISPLEQAGKGVVEVTVNGSIVTPERARP